MSAGLLKRRAQMLCSSLLGPASRRCRTLSSSSPPPSPPSPPPPSPPPAETPLYGLHLARHGRMVPYAGYCLPVVYPSLKHVESHHFTRRHASLFDVSHMVQHWFRGPGAARFLETVCPSGIAALAPMRGGLTTFLWPGTGGIVDDAIVSRLSDDEFYVVTNGACRDKDIKYFDEQMAAFADTNHRGGPAAVERTSYQAGLLALQGPESASILQETLAGPGVDLSALHFGSTAWASVRLVDGTASGALLVSRGGYTGEDGFEISLPPGVTLASDARLLAETLLATAGPARLQLAGLGARDSLRLEAGMCLYGHDLDDTITPVEAGLSWVIAKERRAAAAAGRFNGAERILAQLTPRSKGGTGVERRRVGLVFDQGAGPAAREGAAIQSTGAGGEAEDVGKVTSGMPSPTIGRNIAMGYVRDGLHRPGTEVDVIVRGKPRRAVVAKMPFVPTRYFRGS